MTERKFTLIGDKCVFCDQQCSSLNGNMSWSTRFGELGIVIRKYGISCDGSDGCITSICMAQFQPDGETPRVCLRYEDEVVMDAETNKIISQTISPVGA
jgi:hypothetical protein